MPRPYLPSTLVRNEGEDVITRAIYLLGTSHVFIFSRMEQTKYIGNACVRYLLRPVPVAVT